MKTNELAKATLVDDGECVSFHRFSPSLDTSSFTYDGFELLVLPEGDFAFWVAGQQVLLTGPQVMLLGPGLEHGWRRVAGGYSAAGCRASAEAPGSEGNAGSEGGAFTGGGYEATSIRGGGDSCEGASVPGAGDGCEGGGLSAGSGLAIRWPADLLGEGFLDKRQTQAIAGLLERAASALCFESAVLSCVLRRLEALRGRTGFAIYLDLLGLLHELSAFRADALFRGLPVPAAAVSASVEKKSGIEEVMALMQANYSRPMTLEEMARKACMTKGSFCRSFRARTGKTYSETLNEIRLGHICRLLSETTDTVSEIAYRSGYQNIHYFHRHFKRQKGCTPLEFRAGMR